MSRRIWNHLPCFVALKGKVLKLIFHKCPLLFILMSGSWVSFVVQGARLNMTPSLCYEWGPSDSFGGESPFPQTSYLSWPWASPLCFSLGERVLEMWVRVQICHSIQDQLWKLEVRRLLQWDSNGRIMQLRSSGCPHYLAVLMINGLKCMLSKWQEKCDSSSKIQMVPLHCCHSGSLRMLFSMYLIFRWYLSAKKKRSRSWEQKLDGFPLNVFTAR